jgi:O-antigen/teichoic acid export membrane protein
MARLLIVFGCLQPAVLLQEVWRYVFVAEGKPRAAALNDSVWLAFTLVLLSLTQVTQISFTDAIIFWGIGAAAAAAFGIHQTGTVPRPRRAGYFLAQHRTYWSRIGPEQFVLATSWQVGLLLVAAIAGLEAVGALRAAQTALGPASVFIVAAPLALVPELARLDAEESSIKGWAAVSAAFLGFLPLIAGVLLLNLPEFVGEWFLGSSWSAGRAILPMMTLFLASTGINMGFLSGLRALGAVHRSLRVRLFVSPLHVAALSLGTAAAGVKVGVGALAIVNLAAGFIWAEQFRRAVKDRERDSHGRPCLASEEVLEDKSISA